MDISSLRVKVLLVFILINSEYICSQLDTASEQSPWPWVIMPSALTMFPYECLKFKTLKERDNGMNTWEAWCWHSELEMQENASQRQCLLHKDYRHGMCRILTEIYKWVAFFLFSSSRLLLTGTHDTKVFQGFFSLLSPICCRNLGPDSYSLFKANIFDVDFLEIHSIFETLQGLWFPGMW